jgi:RecA/RadA recombinase
MKFPLSQLNQYFDSNDIVQGIFSVYGDFGVGKTTFALQTAINTAILGKEVIFVYTKPNFPSAKIQLLDGNLDKILDKILFIQLAKFSELYRIIFNFEFLILKFLNEKRKKFSIIIIDSITNLYRLELNMEKKERNYNLNYQLNHILANLAYLNDNYKIEIMIVNEVSKRNLGDQITEVESGGKVMEFWADKKLMISKTKKLNERKFLFSNISKNYVMNFNSNLRDKGFE